MEYIESIIVGGGQAGLCTSYHLTREGKEHIIFEKSSQPANVWRNERWDSFTLVTPNWLFRLPGRNNEEKDPHGFMPLKEVIKTFEDYIQKFHLPIQYNTEVKSVEYTGSGYIVRTSENTYKAKNVVIATGFFQKPFIPEISSGFSPDILQIHSVSYRNPESLPQGAVLVIGSGQSGAQIAEELYLSGRNVYLSVGNTSGRVPRRYRGKDVIEWLDKVHFFDLTSDQLPPGQGKFDAIPHVSGTKGGHTLNLHQFVRDGVKLLGKIRGVENRKAVISPGLYNNLSRIDNFDSNFRGMVDNYVKMSGEDAPEEEIAALKDGYYQPIYEILDLKKENINTIIWAGGYKFDYSFIRLPVCDTAGFPDQDKGVSRFPGLYFVGMPWMPSQSSGFLHGIARYSGHIASRITQVPTDNMPEAVL